MNEVFRPWLTLVCVLSLAMWSVGCGDKGGTTGAPAGTGETSAAGSPANGADADSATDAGQSNEPQTAETETAGDDSDDFFFNFDTEGGSALGNGGFGFDDE